MTRVAQRAGAVAALLAVLVGGLWVLGAEVAGTTNAAVVLVGIWFAAVGAAVLLTGSRLPALRMTLRVAFVAATVVLTGAGAYTSLHETTVNERLEYGMPASKVAPQAVDDLLAPQP